MKKVLFVILMLSVSTPAFAPDRDDPWAAWPYRLKLHVTTPELADFSGMAVIRLNLGPNAASNCADVRILDDKGREQPWRLLSTSPSGSRLVFRTVKGTRDYTLIFGNMAVSRPDYGLTWSMGKALVDDRIADRAHTHGLWEWVTSPVVSGSFAHTSPLKDRIGYHGTSEIGELPIEDDTVLEQYVRIDPASPPEQILVRVAFASKPNEGDWERKPYLNLSWGKNNIRGLPGTLLRMGELPRAGEWVRLDLNLADLARRAGIRSRDGYGTLYLYGVGYATDKGRAWWDLTSLGDIPGEAEAVSLERAPSAPPTFVYQRLLTLKLAAGPGTMFNELHFFSTDAKDAAWDFGDGSTSQEWRPSHLFEGTDNRRVTLTVTGPAGKVQTAAADIEGFRVNVPAQEFGIELVSCPFVVRSDDKALFNLRLDGNPPKALGLELRAVLLDANDRELRRESADVSMLPGDKHPTLQAFSFNAGSADLASIRFELLFRGRPVAKRAVTVCSSRAALDKLRLEGDRFVDALGNPVVVRCEITEGATDRKAAARAGLPLNTLVVGDVPMGTPDFAARLRKAFAESGALKGDAVAKKIGVSPQPAWSMPCRQLLALAAEEIDPATDVVLVASASEMALNGVPARVGVDAISACVDQLRRRSGAQVVLLTPVAYAGLEDLARQYAVGLRLLGIEKNVTVIDVYSRSVSLGGEDPDVLKADRIVDGVLVREMQSRLADKVVSAVLFDLLNPGPFIRSE